MDKKIEKSVGQNIRVLRESIGMTQEMLAAKLQLEGCDITRSAVAKIEVGQRHLYPDEVILIKRILNVSYEEIFKIDSVSNISSFSKALLNSDTRIAPFSSIKPCAINSFIE